MATLRFGDREVDVEDGSRVLDACDELGLPIGCHDGQCGHCIVAVVEGAENLGPPGPKEQGMGMGGRIRLACQCVIESGLVELSLDW